MKRMAKRTVPVNCKFTETDWQLLLTASGVIWPQAELSKAGIVVGLAKLGANGVLAAKEPLPRKPPKKS
jgi:hypothetical protein